MKVSLNRFVLKETLNGLRRRNSLSWSRLSKGSKWYKQSKGLETMLLKNFKQRSSLRSLRVFSSAIWSTSLPFVVLTVDQFVGRGGGRFWHLVHRLLPSIEILMSRKAKEVSEISQVFLRAGWSGLGLWYWQKIWCEIKPTKILAKVGPTLAPMATSLVCLK